MRGRSFWSAFLFSLSVHVLGMSVISLIAPEDMGGIKPYSRINFLGSVLEKTAFDIMLEKAEMAGKVNPRDEFPARPYVKLDIPLSRREFVPRRSQRPDEDISGSSVLDFLAEEKMLPDFVK